MQCAHCGIETDAGTSFTISVGGHTKAGFARMGTINSTPAADQVAGAEQVFLCFACQIADRHRAFRRAVLIGGAIIVCSPAIDGLVLYPSFVPGWSAFSAFLLSVPVVGIVVGVGSIIGLGLLTRVAIDAFGDLVWIAWTWRKPYALSGEDPNVDHTAEGEAFAIGVRRADLKRQGYDVFLTRKAQSRLGRTARVGRIAATALRSVGLFVLGLLTLACIGLSGLLLDRIH